MNNHHKSKVIAVCGKGGVGKTALTAMIVTALSKRITNGRLLVIDADPVLGLPLTLDINVKTTISRVRDTIISDVRTAGKEDITDIAGRIDYMIFEALVQTDTFSYLAMGRPEAKGCFCPVNNLLRDSIGVLAGAFDMIIIDGEAGIEQINRQIFKKLDLLIAVTDTSKRGIQTVEHIKKLIIDEKIVECKKVGIIFNKVLQNERLLIESAKHTGLEIMGYIPQDRYITEYDLTGKPLSQLPDDSAALCSATDFVKGYLI